MGRRERDHPRRGGGSGGEAAPRGRVAPTVLAAAGLVAVQALVVVGYSVYLAVRALVDDPAESVAGVELGALLGLLLGVGLLAAARGLAGLRGWARGPVTTVQLLVLLTGLSLASSGPVALGAAATAVAVLGLLFSPRSRAAFDAADR